MIVVNVVDLHGCRPRGIVCLSVCPPRSADRHCSLRRPFDLITPVPRCCADFCETDRPLQLQQQQPPPLNLHNVFTYRSGEPKGQSVGGGTVSPPHDNDRKSPSLRDVVMYELVYRQNIRLSCIFLQFFSKLSQKLVEIAVTGCVILKPLTRRNTFFFDEVPPERAR